jgi:hypothetical protein
MVLAVLAFLSALTMANVVCLKRLRTELQWVEEHQQKQCGMAGQPARQGIEATPVPPAPASPP